MKTVIISASENAFADGSDCASEWIDRKEQSGESLSAWRARCRANIVSNYERGVRCAICAAETCPAAFQELLSDWDRGFDEIERGCAVLEEVLFLPGHWDKG